MARLTGFPRDRADATFMRIDSPARLALIPGQLRDDLPMTGVGPTAGKRRNWFIRGLDPLDVWRVDLQLSPLSKDYIEEAAQQSDRASNPLYVELLVRWVIAERGSLPVFSDALVESPEVSATAA